MTADAPHPRDLVGYGGHTPDPRWPGQASRRQAGALNYEEGGEVCVLHGDAHSESVLTDLGAVAALPGARNLNVELNFEYGSRVGFWEVMSAAGRCACHRVCRRHGSGAQSTGGRGDRTERLRSGLSRAALDRLPVRAGAG